MLGWIFVPLHAVADCDRLGHAKRYGIADEWRIEGKEYLGTARFGEICTALDDCYAVLGRSRLYCVREYSRQLKSVCHQTHGAREEALTQCKGAVDQAVNHVDAHGGGYYREAQRKARNLKRKAQQKARAEKRRRDRLRNQ